MGVVDPGGSRTFGSYFRILGEPPNRNSRKKRKIRGERINLNFDESSRTEEVFMMIESDTKGKSLAKYNPFLFAKATEMALGGKPLQTTMLRDGKILMRLKNQTEANKLKKLNLNHGTDNIKVNIYEHKTLNSTKGIIRCDACKFLSEEELVATRPPSGVRIVSDRDIQGQRHGSPWSALTRHTNVSK